MVAASPVQVALVQHFLSQSAAAEIKLLESNLFDLGGRGMFTADHIYERMQDRPFKPLRIVTSAGESYEVHHPELVVVGERYLFVGTASSRNPKVFDTSSHVSLSHITALEDLPIKTRPQGNGQQ